MADPGFVFVVLQSDAHALGIWGRMRRRGELSKDQEPSLPHQFCSDCIIATRGYDFREGQLLRVYLAALPKIEAPALFPFRPGLLYWPPQLAAFGGGH